MSLPPVVILCGGRGTRLQHASVDLPKPLVEIGEKPILQHVVELYARQGATRFVLCTGYKRELIEAWADRTAWPADVRVECVDTGLDTPTGGRVLAVQDRVGDGTFMATYADGLADVDLARLLDEHRAGGATATVTVVQPELQFGVALVDADDVVRGFEEKPRSSHWVNGGFFCFEPGVFDVLAAGAVLEREPLETLAAAGRLRAHRHTGFWQCMDTYKDATRLNDLWAAGDAPWTSRSS